LSPAAPIDISFLLRGEVARRDAGGYQSDSK
jgi:hypothetical protein